MIEEFKTMWCGHHGRINVAKHGIESDPSTQRPIQSTAHHAGSKAREIERQEVKLVLSEKDIEPAQTKLALLIVFAPKKMSRSAFSSISQS